MGDAADFDFSMNYDSREGGESRRCSKCGAEVYWEEHDGRWRLVSIGGHKHICPTTLPTSVNPFATKK